MAGTIEGGAKASATNKAKYGSDFYKRIGATGGKNSNTGGFAYMKANGMVDKIKEAGRRGGQISTRKKEV
jgi:general stress protein YciG